MSNLERTPPWVSRLHPRPRSESAIYRSTTASVVRQNPDALPKDWRDFLSRHAKWRGQEEMVMDGVLDSSHRRPPPRPPPLPLSFSKSSSVPALMPTIGLAFPSHFLSVPSNNDRQQPTRSKDKIAGEEHGEQMYGPSRPHWREAPDMGQGLLWRVSDNNPAVSWPTSMPLFSASSVHKEPRLRKARSSTL